MQRWAEIVEFALSPNDCVVSTQGETKAALLSVEVQPWQNAAAGKDPARGCPDSPVPPGCPRGVGRGRAPPGAVPEPGKDWSRCCFLQLVINLFEKLNVH